jgi:phage terminase small subunit
MNALAPVSLSFVEHYLTCYDVRKVARKMGISMREATEILESEPVAAEIKVRVAEIAKRLHVDQERVLLELASIAFLDPAELFDDNGRALRIDEIPLHARRGLAAYNTKADGQGGVKRTFRMVDKLKALDLLGKYMGMAPKDLRDATVDDLGRAIEQARARRLEAESTVPGEAETIEDAEPGSRKALEVSPEREACSPGTDTPLPEEKEEHDE